MYKSIGYTRLKDKGTRQKYKKDRVIGQLKVIYTKVTILINKTKDKRLKLQEIQVYRKAEKVYTKGFTMLSDVLCTKH